jgi:hypothetical protein
MQMLIKNVNNFINEFLIDFHLLSSDFRECFDVINIEGCMTSPIELIVDLKEPGIYIQIICY